MSIENFSYFILGIVTIITIAFNAYPVDYEDKCSQTEEDYVDFPGIETVPSVIKKSNKTCKFM